MTDIQAKKEEQETLIDDDVQHAKNSEHQEGDQKTDQDRGEKSKNEIEFSTRSIVLLGFVIVFAAATYLAAPILREFLGQSQQIDFDKIDTAVVQEWKLSGADHEVIAASVAACSQIYDLDKQPNFVRAQLRLDVLPDGRRINRNMAGSSTTEHALTLTNYQRASIFLSNAISRARVEAVSNAKDSYYTMFWLQFSIIVVGAMTTILISIKSISGSEKYARLLLWVGIAAIISSSAGTALSAFNSFIGPRESYFKSTRSLSGLRQLHLEIASQVASSTDKCVNFDPEKKDELHAKQIQDWMSRLSSIVNVADSGSSSSPAGAKSGNPGDAGGASPVKASTGGHE